jgi:hypothetical protein
MAVTKWSSTLRSLNVSSISGLDSILANLNKEVQKIENRTQGGVREALLQVKRDALPMTPIKTGNLRGSCYTNTFKLPQGPAGEIGYEASYAPFVHEIDKEYTVGHWKFLEYALKMNYYKILDIIRRRAHVDTGRD